MTEVSLNQNFDELFIKAEQDPPQAAFIHLSLAGRQIDRQIDRQIYIQIDRQVDRQIDRQIDRFYKGFNR